MKKILPLVFALALVSLSFAAPLWETYAAVAVTAAAALLGVVYAIGTGFGINELQMMAKEEFFQLIALGVMVAVFVGANSLIDGISTNPLFTTQTTPPATDLQQAAIATLNSNIADTSTVLGYIATMDQEVSENASASTQCTAVGVGYSVSTCGGYNLLATPISMAGGIAGFALGEQAAMMQLIQVSSEYSLLLLLPLGILLRTFRFTRGAGGLLIALGISMHLLLPAGIIFGSMLGAEFLAAPTSTGQGWNGGCSYADCPYASGYTASPSAPTVESCNAADITGAEDNAVATYQNMRNALDSYLYILMVEATLGPVIALLMFAAGLRALTALAGAEIDVSAISRFV
jgi:hypothetical protein